jgi:nucleotide-binding universal stress UspA family protein
VPTDFSESSNSAYKYALRLAQQFCVELHIIHVVEPVLSPRFAGLPDAPAFSDKELASTDEELRAWADSVDAMGMTANMILRNGLPAHEIVEAAKDLDIDLIVIASHGYTGWKHFCIGSTAERVVRAAPCSVLVVREKEHEFV